MNLQASEYEITDGYVGGLGEIYNTANDATLSDAILRAANYNDVTEEEIKQLLLKGKEIAWRESPNYYYDHGTGYIRRKRKPVEEKLVECACGHSVPQSQVMSTSNGSSCSDCYDRMSE